MTSDQFSKIREYIENQPILKYDLDFVCTSCNHNNSLSLQGLQDFF